MGGHMARRERSRSAARRPRRAGLGAKRGSSSVRLVSEAFLHLRQPFVIYDEREHLIAWNKAFAELHCDADGGCILRKGMAFDEIAKWRVRTGFYAAPDAGTTVTSAAGVHQRARGGVPYQLRDGRWMYIDRYDLPDGSNIGVWLDITAVKRAEQERLALESQLHHAQRLESLGTLAGDIAHDLNNTLVPIRALAKTTMRRLEDGSREHANLALILQASERASALVRQILEFGRKEAPTREAVDLAALLRSSTQMLGATLPATIRIVEAIDAAPPVIGDPGLLHQVIVNLVVNAAHAIGDRYGAITVALGTITEAARDAALGHPLVRLSVSDTGCGMDEATRRRIFEPFFTTKSVGEGTGLGLAVVHGIVLSHGGRIDVTSAPGAGTRIDILLPAAAEAEVATASAAISPAATPGAPIRSRRNRRRAPRCSRPASRRRDSPRFARPGPEPPLAAAHRRQPRRRAGSPRG
jgi:signal transduction histidine kinase